MQNKRVILLVISLILLIDLVYAGVPFAQAFYGTAKDSNGNNLNGTIVARINGVDVGKADIIEGIYNLAIQSQTSSGTVYFYLNSQLIGNYVFNPFQITELNLLLNVPILTSQTSLTSAFQGNSETTKIDWEQFCEPNWQCSEWGECNGEVMTRVCHDTNDCVYNYNEPVEITSCGGNSNNSMQLSLNVNIPSFFEIIIIFEFLFLGLFAAIIFIIRKRLNKNKDRKI